MSIWEKIMGREKPTTPPKDNLVDISSHPEYIDNRITELDAQLRKLHIRRRTLELEVSETGVASIELERLKTEIEEKLSLRNLLWEKKNK